MTAQVCGTRKTLAASPVGGIHAGFPTLAFVDQQGFPFRACAHPRLARVRVAQSSGPSRPTIFD